MSLLELGSFSGNMPHDPLLFLEVAREEGSIEVKLAFAPTKPRPTVNSVY